MLVKGDEERKIKKLLVANRGEIAIRIFRACTELNIQTVAVYSQEDSDSYHRFKADEAYLIGEGKQPIEAYLDIEGIIDLAKRTGVDAIHPGYGFLSENASFAQRCEEEGIIFVGPAVRHLEMFGDKVAARNAAIAAGIPVIPGSDGPITSLEAAKQFGTQYGYPIIIKATLGGGGRGMRIVHSAQEVEAAYHRAKSEAKKAFGQDEIYVEKYLERPKHIEVQILGDHEGNILHLYERDCSVQRRYQKVVEVAPSVSLPAPLREKICAAAVQLMKKVEYSNAGTVEFLVTPDENFYFIEVNPRIQVEHTITEMVTGVDIVQAQIQIAEGVSLHSEELALPPQEEIACHGYAIQARITTEDPANHFLPDTGKITVYRSGGGFGVRLDTGNAYQGAVIKPHYDSLLVKLSTWGLTFEQAVQKMLRNLREFRIRGIKTNIPFLQNVMQHENFITGQYDTSFIDTTPELFQFVKSKDRGTKMLTYIAKTTINGFPGLEKIKKPPFDLPQIPAVPTDASLPRGTKQILEEEGVAGLIAWIKAQNQVLLTDTTFRDAHQSLLATRVRTCDLKKIAQPEAYLLPQLFSLEMWGGATFDVSMRFLFEDPWERLKRLRRDVPNLLFQMLLRGANAVGYTNYPDNVIRDFVKKAAANGIDLFRIFDSLNWVRGMEVAIEAVLETGKVAEATMCYTGDILDVGRGKYDLSYYQNLAKELEQTGAQILGIKDMAGLLKPDAAYQLISTLKETVDLPIHLHTHDTSGNGISTYTRAVEAGVDIVDVAMGAMAGLTSQPSMNTLYYALEHHERRPQIEIEQVEAISRYWEATRKYYQGFESGMLAPHTEVYRHEMPGGQYSNLQQQAKAVGLKNRFEEVKEMYRRVNLLFGDIVKVTPSSKVVGDMALFMVQNDLTEDDILERGETIDFPDSVVEFFQGYLGQPYGGFPQPLQQIILKGRDPLQDRPGKILPPADFAAMKAKINEVLNREATEEEVLSYAMYPKVFLDFVKLKEEFGNLSVLDTPTFFYGMRLGEVIQVNIEPGKTLIVKLIAFGHPQADGTRAVYFEMNGQPRVVTIRDENIQSTVVERRKADKSDPSQIGAMMPGVVLNILVKKGEEVKRGEHLLVTDAMKMETTVQAPFDGVIKALHVTEGETISTGDLLLEIEAQ